MKQLRFLGDALKRLREFPAGVWQDAGYQLDKVQRGEQPADFKPMPSIGRGVEEIRTRDESGCLSRDLRGALRGGCIRASRIPEENAGNCKARYRSDARAFRSVGERAEMSEVESFESVWDAISDTPEEAANLRTRADLMRKIAEIIEEGGWSQKEAATRCHVTQPRINDLLRGRISRFSLDALVNIATALGRRVYVELEAA